MADSKRALAEGPVASSPEVATSQAARAEIANFQKAHYRDLLRVALCNVGNANLSDAQDAVGEAMVDVIKNWITLDDPLRYALKATRHAAIRIDQKKRRIEPRELSDAAFQTPFNWAGDPQLSAAESNIYIQQVLDRLANPQHRAIMCAMVRGMKSAEIAELAHKSDEAIRKIIQRATANLRDQHLEHPHHDDDNHDKPTTPREADQ